MGGFKLFEGQPNMMIPFLEYKGRYAFFMYKDLFILCEILSVISYRQRFFAKLNNWFYVVVLFNLNMIFCVVLCWFFCCSTESVFIQMSLPVLFVSVGVFGSWVKRQGVRGGDEESFINVTYYSSVRWEVVVSLWPYDVWSGGAS